MGKRQFVMFGFLAAALVLQALPVGIVTYTELYANGGLEGVVSAFSYFHPGGPLLLRALPFCCCSHDGAGAVYREYPGGSGQNRFYTDDLSVCCIGERMCVTLASGVVAGLLILATVVHGWKTGTLGGDIYHLAHMEIPAHPFGRAGILTEDNLNAEAQRNSQR